MEITGCNIRTLQKVIHNHLGTAAYPVTDSAACDFHIFGALAKHMVDKRSAADAHMNETVTSYLQIRDTDFLYADI
jgi:hypothetical protein